MRYAKILSISSGFLLPLVAAFPSPRAINAVNDTGLVANLSYGSFQGTTDGNVTTFLGMPFAAPPTGNLRFAPPEPPISFNGTRPATTFGQACFQQKHQVFPNIPLPDIPGLSGVKNVSEDCLFVNVVKPTNITSDNPLPVLVWIYGGGFLRGDTSLNPGNTVVERSIALGQPVIYVSANYRISALGFLGGQEVQDAGLGNIGLRDQRFALEWVQEHISSFGGNRSNVTLWGQSSGGISTALQLVAFSGNASDLIHGAFMESGSPIPLNTTASQQKYFRQLVSNTNCDSSSDKLACLRSVPFDTLTEAINQSPGLYSYQSLQLTWQPSVDGVFITRAPQASVMNRSFAKVPIVTGDCDDEGTLFSLGTLNITSNEEFLDYMSTNYLPGITDEELTDLSSAYPQDITDGSPFDTGIRNALTPQYKRLAAIQGDLVFQAPRRFFLENAAQEVPAWAFLYKRDKSTAFVGSYHGSDLQEFYGTTEDSPDFIGTDALINFVNTLNPNTPPSTPQPPSPDSPPSLLSNITWPLWNSSSDRPILLFADPAPSVENASDTYRSDAMQLLTNISLRLEGGL